ncbi:MAG: hypothetical protein HJHJAOHD_02574 [Flavobacteriales bacterium]|nr:hypothetical protein [Flavobacteriales bacterium]
MLMPTKPVSVACRGLSRRFPCPSGLAEPVVCKSEKIPLLGCACGVCVKRRLTTILVSMEYTSKIALGMNVFKPLISPPCALVLLLGPNTLPMPTRPLPLITMAVLTISSFPVLTKAIPEAPPLGKFWLKSVFSKIRASLKLAKK